jgi:diguanylate cyclase (GGDEF)-like protein
MKDDVRYCEFLFLCEIEKHPLKWVNVNDAMEQQAVGLQQTMYAEMVMAMLEDLYVHPNQDEILSLAREVRGETPRNPGIARHNLFTKLISGLYQFRITYRGRRRIEELRDLLKRDRILDDFGILLSIRYLRRDLEDALQRSSDIAVSVLYLDMDHFGNINKQFGQAAGDVVMKAYLESVRDSIGDFGIGYRGVGDETVGLIIGQGHEKAVKIAETIKHCVAALQCQYKEKPLPSVTVSIGVATTPPESRSMDVETLAESRKRAAKDNGKNRIVAS